MVNIAIYRILEKMTEKDKDYRYMATSGLLYGLNEKAFFLDNDLESLLSKAVVYRLYDAACEVSRLALTCLSALVKIIHEVYLAEMVIKLCDTMQDGQEQHREISSIALKTILCEVPTSSAKCVLVFIIPKLIKRITAPVTEQHREISSIALKTILCEVPTSSAKCVLVFIIPKLIKRITAPVTSQMVANTTRPKVIKLINMQLREKSVKTKVGAFSVLKEFAVVLPDSVSDHTGSLIPRIEKAMCISIACRLTSLAWASKCL